MDRERIIEVAGQPTARQADVAQLLLPASQDSKQAPGGQPRGFVLLPVLYLQNWPLIRLQKRAKVGWDGQDDPDLLCSQRCGVAALKEYDLDILRFTGSLEITGLQTLCGEQGRVVLPAPGNLRQR